MKLAHIIAFLKLVRWFHELLAILPFSGLYIIILLYSKDAGLNCAASISNFVILCVCVQLLIAAGCVLNDIMDHDIDKINKPNTHIIGRIISLDTAKLIFVIISLLAAALSVYISVFIFKEWAFISLGVYVLSIIYDVYLKKTPLLGNILIALLASFIPLVLLFFAEECILVLNNERINALIYLYAVFPFLVIIPRELSLDISDIEGDKACGCKTLPILIGEKKAKYVVIFFILILLLLSFFAVRIYPYLFYTFCIVDLFLCIYIYLLYKSSIRIDYIKAGRFLWFTMIIGLIGFTVSTILR